MIVINIDTSRVSKLAIGPLEQGELALLQEVEKGSAHFVLCFTRIRELTRVSDPIKRLIVSFLSNVPTLFGQPESVLEESEIAAGCARAIGKRSLSPRPFALDSSDWGTGDQVSGLTVADFVHAANPEIMQDSLLRSMASEGDIQAKLLRSAAAVVIDRSGPARANIERYLARRRLLEPSFAMPLTAGEVLERAGGLQAFPTLHLLAELRAARLTDRVPALRNDLFDEDIARFHPYSAVSILDHATTTRFWRARVPGFQRVVSDFGRAADVVKRVRDGELTMHPFDVPRVA